MRICVMTHEGFLVWMLSNPTLDSINILVKIQPCPRRFGFFPESGLGKCQISEYTVGDFLLPLEKEKKKRRLWEVGQV